MAEIRRSGPSADVSSPLDWAVMMRRRRVLNWIWDLNLLLGFLGDEIGDAKKEA